ncbi:MAG TPA: hypothetical protein VF383_13345 [Candidatus Dormibacteraeota bacterium]
MEPDGTAVLSEGSSVNGNTVLIFVVGSGFAFGGVSLIAQSGLQLANIAWGTLFAALGLLFALIGGSLTFLTREWRLNTDEASRYVRIWPFPFAFHTNYVSPVAVEIRHQLTRSDLSVDLLMLRTASGRNVLIAAADNAPDACYKVLVWRGRQVTFDGWTIGEPSERRPAMVDQALEKGQQIAATLSDLDQEIAPRIVELANFFSAATHLPATVMVQANHGRTFSIGGD